jgi:hypothetical protein
MRRQFHHSLRRGSFRVLVETKPENALPEIAIGERPDRDAASQNDGIQHSMERVELKGQLEDSPASRSAPIETPVAWEWLFEIRKLRANMAGSPFGADSR